MEKGVSKDSFFTRKTKTFLFLATAAVPLVLSLPWPFHAVVCMAVAPSVLRRQGTAWKGVSRRRAGEMCVPARSVASGFRRHRRRRCAGPLALPCAAHPSPHHHTRVVGGMNWLAAQQKRGSEQQKMSGVHLVEEGGAETKSFSKWQNKEHGWRLTPARVALWCLSRAPHNTTRALACTLRCGHFLAALLVSKWPLLRVKLHPEHLIAPSHSHPNSAMPRARGTHAASNASEPLDPSTHSSQPQKTARAEGDPCPGNKVGFWASFFLAAAATLATCATFATAPLQHVAKLQKVSEDITHNVEALTGRALDCLLSRSQQFLSLSLSRVSPSSTDLVHFSVNHSFITPVT